MLRTRRHLHSALVAVTLLAPLPLFAIGRDLTPPRMATPDYIPQWTGACVTENGFLLRWSSQTHAYGATADTAGVPRMPASSMPPLMSTSITGKLFPSGDGCLALSQTGITELDAGGAVRRSVILDQAAQMFSSSAFDGTNFFLVVGSVGFGYTGRLVDRNGHVLSTTKLPIPDPGFSSTATDVTASADGGFTVIVAGSGAGVYALQINAAGQVTGRADLLGAGSQGRYLVTAATNAGQTVAAWTTSGSTFMHTFAMRGGSIVRESILTATVELSQSIALLPSGDGFILLRNAYVLEQQVTHYSLQANRLDATGMPRDATPTRLFNGYFSAAAATSRTLVLLSFREGLDTNLTETSAAITDSGIVPSATYNIVATAVKQTAPAVASDGVDFFGAWIETTSTTMSIMAGRVTRSGLPLDGTGLAVAAAPSSRISPPPLGSLAIAFGTGVYLVVYASGPYAEHFVMGRRYARDGTPIDAAPFLITANGREPSVAFGGGRFLVAWQLADASSVGGGTVGSDGSLGPQRLLTPAPGQLSYEESGKVGEPVVGWNGRHFIVAYDMAAPPFGGVTFTNQVRVFRVSALGTPLDAHTIEAVNGGNDATIACSDQECMVSATRYYSDIVTAVVHDDATLRADAPKFVANGRRASYAAVAFDGATYILAWRTDDSLLGLARISRGGEPYALVVPATVSTINYSLPSSPPALAANSAGNTAIVTSELNAVWLIDRARFYFASELFVPRRHASGF